MQKMRDKMELKLDMAELKALQQMPDEQIDFTDIPEVDAKTWKKNAVVGKFYRPVKEMVTMRLDADVLSYFRSKGKGYQTQINEVLREVMTAEVGKGKRTGATIKIQSVKRSRSPKLAKSA